MAELRAPSTTPIGRRIRHRRLARTLSPARWGEYRRLLDLAVAQDYAVVSLESWLQRPRGLPERVLILRHDVDQHPRAVGPLLAAERERSLRATWYFRWRTARPETIAAVRRAGGEVGLHYETLTRLLLRLAPARRTITEALLDDCRAELSAEILAFRRLFGPIMSICPHGDSRVPGVYNGRLTEGAAFPIHGVLFDGNEAIRRHALGAWLTDRSRPDGGWKPGMDPQALLTAGVTPILCLTHPNNLASGAGLWVDRVLAAALPVPKPGAPSRLVRTGSDEPPAGPR